MREGHVFRMQFTSATVLFASKDRFWYRHDLATGDVAIIKFPSRVRVKNGIIHPDGDLLKTQAGDDQVETYRVTKVGFEPVGRAGTIPKFYWLIGFNPSGDRYLVNSIFGEQLNDIYHLFDSATDTLVTSLESPSLGSGYYSWLFSPDGRRAYATSYGELFAFDCVNGGPPVVTFEPFDSTHYDLQAMHPDGRILATVENEQTVTFRDTDTMRPLRTYDFRMPRVRCVAFTPDGTRCVLGNSRGKVLLFDVE